MTLDQNEERIPPSRAQRELVIHQSISLWQSLSDATRFGKQLPTVLDFTVGFQQVPSFTKARHRAHITRNKTLHAKGSVTWSITDESGCMAHDSLNKNDWDTTLENEYIRLAKTRTLEQSFLLGVQNGTPCDIDRNHVLRIWPGEEGEFEDGSNYVAALTLAWAYILSSAWAVSQAGKVIYTDEKAPVSSQDTMDGGYLALCGDDPAVTRWWAAVLAPGKGWIASIVVDDVEYQSPWSVRLNSEAMFRIRGPPVLANAESPGSYQSFAYLSEFSYRHGLVNQAKAALGAALAFPSHAHHRVPLSLPAPNHVRSVPDNTVVSQPRKQTLEDLFQVLPNLMALSSAATGLTAVLCSVFFEPSIPCNLCSEWLEPLFSIISSTLDARHLAAMCIRRRPSIGVWWLGNTITGFCKYVLREARSGTPLVNLPSWWWTQLPQSYICLPCPDSIDETGTLISRQKEALLLYLSQDTWSYTPPWKPPGRVIIKDAHIVVQEHACCTGHYLSYQSWSWFRADSHPVVDSGYSSQRNIPLGYDDPTCLGKQTVADLEAIPQDASKTCTQMIFWGLGQQGIAAHDRTLYKSLKEWVGLTLEDSDESGLESGDSDDKLKDTEMIQKWLASTDG